jgi:hypothetical protein
VTFEGGASVASSEADRSGDRLPATIGFDDEEQRTIELRAKKARLIDWNVDCLQKLLKQIVARRNAVGIIDGTAPNEEILLTSGSQP